MNTDEIVRGTEKDIILLARKQCKSIFRIGVSKQVGRKLIAIAEYEHKQASRWAENVVSMAKKIAELERQVKEAKGES